MSFFNKLFGDPNAKLLKELRGRVDAMNAFEPSIAPLTDEQLRAKTVEFKTRLANGESVDDITDEAFAVVREAAKRAIGQRHYDVQLMGGLVLHRGMIAEMRTGEGKTLTSTSPVYLNALVGKGVHLVTVNDYLAKRDAAWMGRVFTFLGLSVGCIQHEGGYVFDEKFTLTDEEKEKSTDAFKVHTDFLRPVSRQDAYAADITYGTNNEFGFDYLRDNMAQDAAAMVQRDLAFAIVDEVDSILVDEARTPLIISAPAAESADTYYKFADVVKALAVDVDYNLDEKMRTSTYTEDGLQKIEKLLNVDNLYESGLENVHHAEQALKAHAMFLKDRDYIVRDGEVLIVDEFTGRVMEGRRYSEGLHQAIEAKEGVKIQRESRTLATITYQNYFRLYGKLAGMTGTAATEAEEFSKTYTLEVVQIPTNKINARADAPDRIYRSENGKLLAVVQEVKTRHEAGQPVLIGTVSVDKNERLSQLLTMAGVPHELLNAKNHEREGEIIAQAGRRGAVTVATNMAGRGVDIILGGNPSVAEEAEAVRALGGLHVIGTERHESRRIDNQLRGRAGRQGDPGSTQFFVSLEDDLMRIFGTGRMKSVMDKLGFNDTDAIESKMITNALEKAQQRVEGHNFDTRKHVLEYDDVLNKHRVGTYERRKRMLKGDLAVAHAEIVALVEREVEQVVHFHTGEAPEGMGDWDPKEIVDALNTIATLDEPTKAAIRTELAVLSHDQEKIAAQRTNVIETAMSALTTKYAEAAETFGGEEQVQRIERSVLLRAIDTHWMRHLDEMTYLRHTIGLRGYAQRDPLVEYKREAFHMYAAMMNESQREVAYNVFKLLDQANAAKKMLNLAPQIMRGMTMSSAPKTSESANGSSAQTVTADVIGGATAPRADIGGGPIPRQDTKQPGRNEPCHCGSGKKFKKCHGA